MFLKKRLQRNHSFFEAAVNLHQAGQIPANSYLLDLDRMQANTQKILKEAKRVYLKNAMTKQISQNSPALGTLAAGGIDPYVAVDLQCTQPIHEAGYYLRHIGICDSVNHGAGLDHIRRAALRERNLEISWTADSMA